jgi:hypothetical protein
MSGFVIQYNRRSRDWIMTEFPGAVGVREAFQRRLELEADRPNGDWEIVSLNSDSVDTIRKTHARYFEGSELKTA